MSPKSQKKPKKSQNEFRFTITPYLNNYKNSSGEKAIYLRIGINGKRIRVAVGISIHEKHWNPKSKTISPAHPQSSDLNLLLRKGVSKANDILIGYRLKGEIPSKEDIQRNFNTGPSSESFIVFALNEINHRSGAISHETYRTHRGDILKLQKFSSDIRFSDINYSLLDRFDGYMERKLKNRPNTRHKTLKTIKTYVNRAIKKGLMDRSPFEDFKMKTQKTERTFLTRGEVRKLEELFDKEILSRSHQNTLQCFLFCCFCGGVRVSDVKALNQHNIRGAMLVFSPQKTRETSAELVRIPLTPRAKKYINKKGALVPATSDQVMNRHLKTISEAAGIDKKITFHVSRHTFATLFLKAGGKVEVLMGLMGHQSLKTTMKYIHVTEESKVDQMNLLSNI